MVFTYGKCTEKRDCFALRQCKLFWLLSTKGIDIHSQLTRQDGSYRKGNSNLTCILLRWVLTAAISDEPLLTGPDVLCRVLIHDEIHQLQVFLYFCRVFLTVQKTFVTDHRQVYVDLALKIPLDSMPQYNKVTAPQQVFISSQLKKTILQSSTHPINVYCSTMHCLCVHCLITPFNRAVICYPLHGGTRLSNQDTLPDLAGKLTQAVHGVRVYTRRNQGHGSPIPPTIVLQNKLHTDREMVSLNTVLSPSLHNRITSFSAILPLFSCGFSSALTDPSWLF